MKTLFFVLSLFCFIPAKAAENKPAEKKPLSEEEAKKLIESAQKVILIIDGKEYLVLIPKGEKAAFKEAVDTAGLKTASDREAKQAKSFGLEIMKQCFLHNYIIVQK